MDDLLRKLEVLDKVGCIRHVNPDSSGYVMAQLGLIENGGVTPQEIIIQLHLELQTHLLAEILKQVTKE